jgi:3-hydroxyacyl-CoA dehydrogenase
VIFAALEAALPATTILATNTSYLDVNALAADLRHPGRFLGLHFFAPAHVMKLLEIVRGAQTSDAALGLAFAMTKILGKIPVVSGVCDGFIGNRILSRYRQATDVLMLEGSCPKGVDEAMRGFGMAMGPYEAQDMSGLDISYANRKRQNLRERKDIRYVTIADTLVEDLGRLGRKSGAGWYDAAGKHVESDAVTHAIYVASDKAGVSRVARSKDEIAERALLAMIMEATRILEEGIAARPQDIDLVMVHGFGFPLWRGGLMHVAQTLTPPVVLSKLEALAADDPLSWSVPTLLRQLVAEGRNFDSLNHERAPA